ncbi:MAG: SusC/RagA family TonB-linked outer membrane protein [Ignavibacteria bacterium]|nr:SusC/RagA family TonB-linked outer membrane protein [Ignavibacteria bacterium]
MLRISLAVVMVLCSFAFASAQVRTITGKVTDAATKKTMGGVKITAKGTVRGAFTRQDGSFSLVVPSDATKLVFEYVGFKKKEVVISGENIDVALTEDILQTEELVVTALGIKQEKKALGYSVQEIKGSEVAGSREVNVTQGLAGKVAGVQVIQSSGSAGASASVRIRGVSSITGNNEPLWVVDGIPIDNSSSQTEGGTRGVDQSNRAIDINPDDIEDINVLKGAAAATLYGIRAANGVILVTTKRGKEGSNMNVSYSFNIGFDNVNKLPEVQTMWSQGQGNPLNEAVSPVARYGGPNSGALRSWGARIDTLRWSGNAPQTWTLAAPFWDRRGTIVGQSAAPNGERVVPINHLEQFFQTGQTLNHSLSLTGGGTFGTYYFSLSRMDQTGIVPNNSFDRTTLSFNGTANFTQEFSATGIVRYTNSGGTRIQRGSNTSGVMLGLARTPVSFDYSGYGTSRSDRSSYLFPDGRQRTFIGFGSFDNPYFTAYENPFRDRVDRMQAVVELKYKPTTWLNIMYRAGTDFFSERRKQIFHNASTYAIVGTTGAVAEDNYFNQDLNSELIATGTFELADGLSLVAKLGQNFYQFYNQNQYQQGTGLSLPEFYNVAATTTQITREFQTIRRTAAAYGEAQLSYKNWAFINGSIRNEWASTLPLSTRSFLYGGASASLVFTEMLGMAEDGFLGFGKVRASYGVVGNSAPAYVLNTLFVTPGIGDGWTSFNATPFPFNGRGGFLQSVNIGNPDLRPESVKEIEFGTELRFMNGFLSLDLSYFNKISSDLILPVPIATSTGYQTIRLNAGQISNVGVEAVANFNFYRDNDLRIDLALNFTSIKNNVDRLADGVEQVGLGGFTSAAAFAIAGKPYSATFGFGFRQDAQGRTLIQGATLANGMPNPRAGLPVGQDPTQKYLGDPYPTWTGGVRPTISYKGIRVTALLDIRQGGQMWNGTRAAQVNYGMPKETENRTDRPALPGVLTVADATAPGGWRATDQVNNIPLASPSDPRAYARVQDYYVNFFNTFSNIGEPFMEDMSWLRLRELSVSYSLPSSLLEGSIVRGLTVNVTGRNIWLSTKYSGIDPETNLLGANNAQGLEYYNMPNTRSWLFGIQVNF